MKICLFNVTSTMDAIGTREVGGVEAYVFRLAEALQARGHEVVLFGGQPRPGRGFQPSAVEVRLAPYWETAAIPDLGTRFQRFVQRLHFAARTRRMLLADRWDAILIFKPYDFFAAWAWRRAGFRGRIIASIHGPEFFWIDRSVHHAVDALYAVSRGVAEAVVNRYARPCPVLPNFLRADLFSPISWDHPEPKGRMILGVGRLVGWKGYAILLRAFARVRAKFPDATLCLAGDGPERASLENEAIRLGVADTVRFMGTVDGDGIRRLHRAARLFVQPSIGYESFSIATLEAVASGVPCAVSGRVAIADWFHGSEVLDVFPHGDEEAMAACLSLSLARPWEEARERCRRGRRVVEANFIDTAVAPHIEALCDGTWDGSGEAGFCGKGAAA